MFEIQPRAYSDYNGTSCPQLPIIKRPCDRHCHTTQRNLHTIIATTLDLKQSRLPIHQSLLLAFNRQRKGAFEFMRCMFHVRPPIIWQLLAFAICPFKVNIIFRQVDDVEPPAY